jgi:hypothetical protein
MQRCHDFKRHCIDADIYVPLLLQDPLQRYPNRLLSADSFGPGFFVSLFLLVLQSLPHLILRIFLSEPRESHFLNPLSRFRGEFIGSKVSCQKANLDHESITKIRFRFLFSESLSHDTIASCRSIGGGRTNADCEQDGD